jgi:protocatechuate 3,4-dioxygenase beta subunit
MPIMIHDLRPTRRRALVGLAAAFVPLRAANAAGTCVLTPRSTEGPYYFDPRLEREDISERRPGLPLRVKLRIVDAQCRPLGGARVDVWHADAGGLYSGYRRQGDDGRLSTEGATFMRGTQRAEGSGIVAFDTVYPGWYPGRTAHIHFKVFLDTRSVLTGQLYFPEAFNEDVYMSISAYQGRRSSRTTSNENDPLMRRGGDASTCTIRKEDGRALAELVISVAPASA